MLKSQIIQRLKEIHPDFVECRLEADGDLTIIFDNPWDKEQSIGEFRKNTESYRLLDALWDILLNE